MAAFDIPAEVAHILRVTGASKIAAVGHSEGCTILLASLASQRLVHDSLSIVSLLGPVGTLKSAYSPFRLAAVLTDLEASNE